MKMARTLAECKDIRKRIQAAIEDEAKAGPEYQQLASDTKEMFCGGKCPKGYIAQIGLQTLAVDEEKHRQFLARLLAAVDEECKETSEKQGMLPLPPPFPLSLGERTDVTLRLSRDAMTREWVVNYYKHGKRDDDKSYRTDVEDDAVSTMEEMKKEAEKQGLSVKAVRGVSARYARSRG